MKINNVILFKCVFDLKVHYVALWIVRLQSILKYMQKCGEKRMKEGLLDENQTYLNLVFAAFSYNLHGDELEMSTFPVKFGNMSRSQPRYVSLFRHFSSRIKQLTQICVELGGDTFSLIAINLQPTYESI